MYIYNMYWAETCSSFIRTYC